MRLRKTTEVDKEMLDLDLAESEVEREQTKMEPYIAVNA